MSGSTLTAWRVPGRIEADGDVVTVTRAWPGKERHGPSAVTVEGLDTRGRLRAGTVRRDGPTSLLPPGADPALPALESLAVDGELLVHRAGRRAVLRHDGGYTKVVRPGRSDAVTSAATTGRRLAVAAGLDAPRVLHHDPDRAAVTTSVLPGSPVSGLSHDVAWERIWATWAAAWTRLQGLDPGQTQLPDPDPGDGGGEGLALARHTAADEAEVVRRWAEQALAAGVLPPAWADRAVEAQAALVRAGDPGRLVPTHRDLHDKQLLWDGPGLGVLDLDTACVADPALDPANLAVHADLRRAQRAWSGGSARVVAAAARSVARSAGVDEQRWRTAQLATVTRLACVYAFRPAWRELVLAWAGRRYAELTG